MHSFRGGPSGTAIGGDTGQENRADHTQVLERWLCVTREPHEGSSERGLIQAGGELREKTCR